MGLRTFTNTAYFSYAARDFKKNGTYCAAPKGHPDYKLFWETQKHRCKFGYEVGDLKITGRHYWYLNFCPIKMTAPKEGSGNNVLLEKKIERTIYAMKPKELLFPRFWEVDYNWWWAKEIAMNGMFKEDVALLQIEGLPVKDYLTGKNLGCLKTRRAGFSYKEAADGVWNYNFIPKSISYYFASKDDFLTKDGILNKVKDQLDHLNKNTGGFWLKNRMEHNTLMHEKASYMDKKRNPAGYQSEIIGVILNDPEKVRGKDGIKGVFEEAGSFKNLLKAWEIASPSYRDGDVMTGQLSVFGTGGEEGPSIEGLEEMFNTPDAFDILAFNNIWEEGMEATECGYYVPCYLTYSSFMDDDGNVDIAPALEYDEKERDKKRLLRDPKKLDRRIAEFSRTPSEALQRLSLNIFPVAEILPWLKQLQVNKDLTSDIQYGVLYPDKDGKIQFKPDPDALPIYKYPHAMDDDLSGCVAIYEPPIRDRFGNVPEGIYDVVVDPYYKDQAEDLTSLWSVSVIMQKTQSTPYGDKVVADYDARPMSLETAYRVTHHLALLYNARIQCEIAGGGQGFFDYLKRNKILHLAHFEPTQFNTKENGANERNRNYFMNISTDEKTNGLSYLAQWLMKPRGITPMGHIIYNYHTCKCIPFLQEVVKYNGIRNADRISKMILAMFMFKEYTIIEASRAQENSKTDFYNRQGFGGSIESDETYISLDSLVV